MEYILFLDINKKGSFGKLVCVRWKNGTFEQTCLRKPHERVAGRIVGANNDGTFERTC